MRHFLLLVVLGLFILPLAALAQDGYTTSGTVKNARTQEVVPHISINIKGTNIGTYSNENGAYRLSTTRKLPITLVFTSVGFETREITVNSKNITVDVQLEPKTVLGEEIVVAASRTPERLLESPVSIERVSTATIRNTPAVNYYDILQNVKGVDLTTSSLTFKTPSTRGFNGSGNLRFNQLVDGMDNQAPGLNFSVGSVIGLPELDVESMELLPGASSALYGSGGMNGTLLVNSKSPFKYQGFSVQVKSGVTHWDNHQRTKAPVYDWSLRWAKKIGDRFGFKITTQFFQAQDWQAIDSSNLSRNNVYSSLKPGSRQSDPNYDGVNVYGDEVSASMNSFAQAALSQVPAAGRTAIQNMAMAGMTYSQIVAALGASPSTAPLVPAVPFVLGYGAGIYGNQVVSRTGYHEKSVTDYNTYNYKLGGSLNYMITSGIEASLSGYFGTGTAVYTGADRYSLRNLKMAQYKLELKSKSWFFRAYTTQENSGDSYASTITSILVNQEWKTDRNWFQQYVGTYSALRLSGMADAMAHESARLAADQGRYLPGSPEFKQAFDKVTGMPIGKGGSRFADRTDLYHVEGQANLSDHFKGKMDVVLGVNYRQYVLNSQGTIFADTAGTISTNEIGGYLQLTKKLLKDVLKLTVSGRYDKHQNFEGRFTPRASMLVKVAKNNNIRLSYQTAYRFPSTQDQYINLRTPGARLVGGLAEFGTYFKFNEVPAYTAESVIAFRTAAGNNPTPASVAAAAANLKPAEFKAVKPESVNSFEIGYKGVIANKVLIDVYGYYSQYKDFLGRTAVARDTSAINPSTATPAQMQQKLSELYSPFTTNNYSVVTNTSTPVKAIGWGISAEYNFYKNFFVNANIFGDELKDVPSDFVTFFNTPKLRYNVGVGSENVYKNIGFNIIARWQDKVFWEGTFGTGEIPAYTTVDAQVSLRIPKYKSMIKIGGTNIFNKYYRSAFGNPSIGALYYVSFGWNVF